MNIIYGVMGYGRGHAMRTAAVLPSLMEEHNVLVLAGPDAYEVLHERFPCVLIPCIGYAYDDSGKISPPLTIRRNLQPMMDLLTQGPATREIDQIIRDHGTDLIISDSEAWTHRAARRMGIPRISFDHVGIIAYCKPPLPREDWLLGHRDALGYLGFMGVPDRIMVSSFYPAVPRWKHVEVIGPLMRDEVLAQTASDGDYLMAYFNKGMHQFLPHIEQALKELSIPVKVYGTDRDGRDGNLEYRPRANEAFVKDMAGCRAMLSTSGNQAMGEAIHFGKPVFVLPEDCFEQRLNAHMVQRMGIGRKSSFDTLTSDQLEEFLLNEDGYRASMENHRRDGRKEAVQTLKRFIAELAESPKPAATTPRLRQA